MHMLNRAARAWSLAALLSTALPMTALAAGYETFQPRPIQEVVSANLVSGPHYRMAPTVRTFDYLNEFVVSTDYGLFTPRSDAMLRRLMREIPAIAALQQITLTDAYGKALAQAALSPIRGVQNLVTNPVQTVEAVPGAIFDIFGRVTQGVESTVNGDKTKYEDGAIAQALQMSSYKRDYARKLGVDPYSSNPVLQKELDSVAWAAAAGNLTVSAASMAVASPIVTGLSLARNLDQAVNIVAAEPSSELTIRDKKMMARMGIPGNLQNAFLGQTQFSPRHKYLLLSALDAMPQTAGRAAVLEAALNANSEQMALFYQQLAELLDGYDEKIAHIVSLQRYNRLVIARDVTGKSVILAPIDYVIWNERAAAAAQGIARQLGLRPGSGKFELWVTGQASAEFKQEAQARGVGVQERVVLRLPLID
jgi:hypothetical protein